MERLVICRICMSENVRLKCIANTELQDIYQKLTSLPFKTEDPRPLTTCYICLALLRKAHKLMEDCLKAEGWFSEMFYAGIDNSEFKGRLEKLSVNDIPSINIDPENYDNKGLIEIDVVFKGDAEEGNEGGGEDILAKIEIENEETSREDIGVFYCKENSKNEDAFFDEGQWDMLENEPSDEVFECSSCKKTFTNHTLFMEHMDTHTKPEKVFKCDKCPKVFAGKGKLDDHIMRTHIESYLYSCKLCNINYALRHSWQRHMSRKHKMKAVYECHKCQKTFSRLNQFRSHNRQVHNVSKYSMENIGDMICSGDLAKQEVTEDVAVKEGEDYVDTFGNETFDREFRCSMCQNTCRNYAQHMGHMNTHAKLGAMFQCDHCPKVFLAKNGLTKHVFTHAKSKQFKCKLCKGKFKHPLSLRSHMEKLHETYKPYKCDICRETFSQIKHLRSHYRSVHQNSTGSYRCDKCPKTFWSTYAVKLHSWNIHNDKTFKCDHCSKVFGTLSGLSLHNNQHTAKRFQCDICARLFTHKSHLDRHLDHHTGAKLFECDMCQKRLGSREAIIGHLRTHHDVFKFKCNVCDETYTRLTDLRQHKRRIHLVGYPCEICKKILANPYSLKSHLRIHTGEKPYVCDICFRCFSKDSTLSCHRRTHTGEKPHKCDCGKSFSQRSALLTHMRSHNGDSVKNESF